MKSENLADHPEGGRFVEVFRSTCRVQAAGRDRTALTHIYFELRRGETSAFHRVESDEVWNLYRGEGLRLLQWDGESSDVEVIELSAHSEQFCHIVPAGLWQAAEPIGDAVLVGCSVGPGFEFEDFTMLTADRAEAVQLSAIGAEYSKFVKN